MNEVKINLQPMLEITIINYNITYFIIIIRVI